MSTLDGDNVAGALIFFTYIGAALFFTGLICRDLLKEYSSMRKGQHIQVRDKDNNTGRRREERDTQLKVSILAALSASSFAVLSYHMLSFLIQSYQSWAPSDSLGDVSLLKIWQWSINSTLFQDFAEAINNDSSRSWWTNLALTYSLGWNIYMTIEGFRYSVPHLWAYFVLDQILPVSFTQNLFLLALLLRKVRSQTKVRSLCPPGATLQVLLVLPVVALLSASPTSVGTAWLIPVLLTTRALLVAPFVVLRPRISQIGAGAHRPAHSSSSANCLGQHESRWALGLIALSISLQLARGLSDVQSSSMAILSALHDSPAVSTLGYDALIGIFSLGVFILMDKGST